MLQGLNYNVRQTAASFNRNKTCVTAVLQSGGALNSRSLAQAQARRCTLPDCARAAQPVERFAIMQAAEMRSAA
jgi:hypothetical protein